MTTQIAFLLDRTGSMSDCHGATVEGFNAYITELQKGDDDIRFTMQQFDSISIDTLYESTGIKLVKPMTMADFQPRAATPLVDAAWQIIDLIEKVAKKKDKVIVAIQTDGYENASQRHTKLALKERIEALKEKGWQFVFLGAGIDAYAESLQMGFATRDTISYGKGRVETQAMFTATASNSRGFASGQAQNVNYSGAQKAAAGDQFDPDAKPATKKKSGGRAAVSPSGS